MLQFVVPLIRESLRAFSRHAVPFRVMHSSFVLAYRVTPIAPRGYDGSGLFGLVPPELSLLLHNNVLLGLLLCMHFYWFYLLLRVGYRIITESAAQASRMEYEGDSDVEDESGASKGRPGVVTDATNSGGAALLHPSPSAAVLAVAAAATPGEGALSPRRGFAAAK